ncbi:hypothetical protein HELRODRAFT_184339 [Helobdella robusta]|uniref:Cilia- and flagella-associated protein 418 n=1 Tax=Helobdella robusta TaxID=6412 RepID=T1FL10_HELRO|nr:hypothetical protein HELRODRAFT_184339 [Helobdella robusta]ESO00989.1 hypothetical protein HELRODRAFT_184339 [Helobdella robusta]
MADDDEFEELLNKIEQKLDHKNKSFDSDSSAKKNQNERRDEKKFRNSLSSYDFEDILNDGPATDDHDHARRHSTAEKTLHHSYNYNRHHHGSLKIRPCDNLRCTTCDFNVSSFDDMAWLEEVGYLFLRNNMPDFNRIKNKLKKSLGSRAYACQCTNLNVGDRILPLKIASPSVKWVCGKHSH